MENGDREQLRRLAGVADLMAEDFKEDGDEKGENRSRMLGQSIGSSSIFLVDHEISSLLSEFDICPQNSAGFPIFRIDTRSGMGMFLRRFPAGILPGYARR